MASYSVQLQLFDLPSGNSPFICVFCPWCLLNARSQAESFGCENFSVKSFQKLKKKLKERNWKEKLKEKPLRELCGQTWSNTRPKKTSFYWNEFTWLMWPQSAFERVCVWTKGGRPNRPLSLSLYRKFSKNKLWLLLKWLNKLIPVRFQPKVHWLSVSSSFRLSFWLSFPFSSLFASLFAWNFARSCTLYRPLLITFFIFRLLERPAIRSGGITEFAVRRPQFLESFSKSSPEWCGKERPLCLVERKTIATKVNHQNEPKWSQMAKKPKATFSFCNFRFSSC